MPRTDALALAQLDGSLGGADYVRPANVYAALFSAAPNHAGGGTEVAYTSYARVALANNSTNFPAASGSPPVKANGVAVTYPKCTGAGVTATHWGLFSASSAGTLLWWSPLGTPKAIAVDDTPSFGIGALTFTETVS